MLWNFARLMRSAPLGPMIPDGEMNDAPPERFVEKLTDEGGDVYVAPVLDALRAVLRQKRAAPSDASPTAPQEGTTLPGTGVRP